MTVDRTALWIVMGLCSMVGVVGMVLIKTRASRPESRLRRVGTVCSAALDGVGVGLSAALLLLLASAAVVRLEDLLR